METLNSGDVPLICMNFSFVSGRSAKYGSWGILETLDQDTTLIPAPKYSAILKYMAENCISSNSNSDQHSDEYFNVFPNPAADWINIESKYNDILNCKIFSSQGHLIRETNQTKLYIGSLKPSIYYIQLISDKKTETRKIIISGN
jgi:hypothetical protein